MIIDEKYIAALDAENESLRARVRELEEQIGVRLDAPLQLSLSLSEARILGMLFRRDLVTTDNVMTELYSARPNEPPDAKIVAVYVCKLRKKLKPYGIVVETLWGRGFCLGPIGKTKLAALYEQARALSPESTP